MGIIMEWVEYMAELVKQYVPGREQHRIHLIPGGTERNETIMNVIRQIEADFGNEETHYIITQDGVRPFVTQRLIRGARGSCCEV